MAAKRRGIQSVYFLALNPGSDPNKGFVSEICRRLNAASTPTVEIELSAAHDGGRGWANAQLAISLIPDRLLSLAISFGHHTIPDGRSPIEWGKSLYKDFFKLNWSRARFVMLVANEDTYTDAEWAGRMSEILRGLRESWNADPAMAATNFPHERITVRRCPPRAVPAQFRVKAGDKKHFETEAEYHFPAYEPLDAKPAARVVSNDGQIVYRAPKDPKTWAYGKNAKGEVVALRQVKLAAFKDDYASHALLLWHPALHRWAFSGGAYRGEKPKADASADNQLAFLSLLEDFLK